MLKCIASTSALHNVTTKHIKDYRFVSGLCYALLTIHLAQKHKCANYEQHTRKLLFHFCSIQYALWMRIRTFRLETFIVYPVSFLHSFHANTDQVFAVYASKCIRNENQLGGNCDGHVNVSPFTKRYLRHDSSCTQWWS